MKKFSKNKNGFTLMELMIAMAIVAIMTVIGIVSIQSGKVKSQLEASAREVSVAIREAQNNALSGKNASIENNCNQYDFTYGGTTYSVGTVSGSGCPLAIYALKNGVTFASGGNFNFSIPLGTFSIISGGNSIQLKKGSDYYYVCINSSSGNVYEKQSGCP